MQYSWKLGAEIAFGVGVAFVVGAAQVLSEADAGAPIESWSNIFIMAAAAGGRAAVAVVGVTLARVLGKGI